MQITSALFFLLVAVTFVILYLCLKLIKNEEKCKNVQKLWLLVASYCFIIYANVVFAAVIGAVTIVSWLCAKKEKAVVFGIIFDISALGFFKYMDFFAESFVKIIGKDFTSLNIILPLGISFYVFSAISYLADVKKGKVEGLGLLDVALYLSYFPKLTSGPIQKSSDFFNQIDKPITVGWSNLSSGVQIFLFGMFKKLILADRLAVFVDQVYKTPKAFGSLTVFIAALAYAIQLYLDFSGYSDMAIGASKVMGIDLPRNFNLPYLSHNVTEHWKRWHISLSAWLQEYVYFPLGGNRKGKIRAYLNVFLTMLVGGIWHGASWTYIAWGAFQGAALVVHKAWMEMTGSNKKQHSLISNVVSIFFTFIFTVFSIIFFRADTLSKAFEIIARIFAFDSGLENINVWFIVSLIFVVGATLFAVIKSKKRGDKAIKPNTSFVNADYLILDLSKFWQLVLFFVICGIILGLAYGNSNPFIYGNF